MQALEEAKRQNINIAIMEIAGRLQIDKIMKVLNPTEVLLVVDRMTGQWPRSSRIKVNSQDLISPVVSKDPGMNRDRKIEKRRREIERQRGKIAVRRLGFNIIQKSLTILQRWQYISPTGKD